MVPHVQNINQNTIFMFKKGGKNIFYAQKINQNDQCIQDLTHKWG